MKICTDSATNLSDMSYIIETRWKLSHNPSYSHRSSADNSYNLPDSRCYLIPSPDGEGLSSACTRHTLPHMPFPQPRPQWLPLRVSPFWYSRAGKMLDQSCLQLHLQEKLTHNAQKEKVIHVQCTEGKIIEDTSTKKAK